MRRIALFLAIGTVGLSACGLAARGAGTLPPRPGAGSGSSATERHPGGSRIIWTRTPQPSDRPAQQPTTSRTTQGSGRPAGAAQPCSPASGGGDGAPATQLVDVRVGTHEGYDRLTFEFAPADASSSGPFVIPHYRVESQDTVTEDGSGLPVAMDGTSFAGVVFWGASGWDVDGRQTYLGPSDLRPGFETLSELRRTGDYERVLSWGIGMAGPSCWQVSVLQDPPRLVVDLPHAPAA